MAITSSDWLAAQNSVLGCALIEPSLVPKIVAQTEERDYSGACRTVYAAIRSLFLDNQPADVVTISDALPEAYKGFLAQLMEIVPSAANIDRYIAICKEQARVLTVRDTAQKIAEAENPDAIRKLLAEANAALVDKPGLKIADMASSLKAFMDEQAEKPSHLKWPISALNKYIHVRAGDFVIVAGYPSAGKSAWALQCAWFWAKSHKVGFFSLETSPQKLFDRQISALAGVSMQQIKTHTIPQDGWDRICRSTTEITSRNLEIIPAAGMSPADVQAITLTRGYDIILVDYLQLLQGSGSNRAEQVAGISMALHTMAQSLKVIVVALSQLRRRGPGESEPDMSSLRESGQVEQDADLIQILYLEDEDAPSGPRIMKIAKNKEGERPKVKLDFDGPHQTFSKAGTPKQNTQAVTQMVMLPDDTPVPF